MFSKEVKSKYPKLPALILPGDHIIFDTPVILRHLARNTPYYKGNDELSLIDSWMELYKSEVFDKAYMTVIMPILGHSPYTNRSYNEGLAAFKSQLSRFDKVGEFLVGNNLSIADIWAVALLHLPFALIMDDGLKKNFAKLTAWFTKVANEPAFVEEFGLPRFCKVTLKPVLPPTEAAEEKKEGKEKKGGKDKKEKKEKKEDEKKDEKEEEGDDDAPKKKPPCPLDILPPSSFDIDEFKREFLANKTVETKRKYLQTTFWNKFDPNGWALWYSDYIKAEGEGEVLFKTSNLLGGFLCVIILI
jgi:elongation factor 1-gamma